MSEVDYIKILATITISAGTLAGGLSPVLIKAFKKGKWLHLANCFGGGVLFSTGLLRFVNESNQIFKEELPDNTFPYTYIITIISFLIMTTLEKLVAHHSHHDEEELNSIVQCDKKSEYHNSNNYVLLKEEDAQNLKTISELEIKDCNQPLGVSQIAILLALAFHLVFDGMALGLQSSWDGTINVWMAIQFHIWADAMTLGISCVKNSVKKNISIYCIVALVVFTVSGILIGNLIKGTAPLVEASLLAINAGTFLYISCIEIWAEEFGNEKYMLNKILFATLACMFCTASFFIKQH